MIGRLDPSYIMSPLLNGKDRSGPEIRDGASLGAICLSPTIRSGDPVLEDIQIAIGVLVSHLGWHHFIAGHVSPRGTNNFGNVQLHSIAVMDYFGTVLSDGNGVFLYGLFVRANHFSIDTI